MSTLSLNSFFLANFESVYEFACKAKCYRDNFLVCNIYLLCPHRHSPLIKCVLSPVWIDDTSSPGSFLQTTEANPQIRRTSWWTEEHKDERVLTDILRRTCVTVMLLIFSFHLQNMKLIFQFVSCIVKINTSVSSIQMYPLEHNTYIYTCVQSVNQKSWNQSNSVQFYCIRLYRIII